MPNVMKIRSVGAELFHVDGWTDGQGDNMTKLMSLFAHLRKASRKIKLSLCLIDHHTLKAYRTVEVWLRSFFTSLLYAVKWPTSGSGRLFPVEIPQYTSRGWKDGISVPSLDSRTLAHSRFIEVIGLSGLREKCINMKRNRHKEGKGKKEKGRKTEITQQLKFPLLRQQEIWPQTGIKRIILFFSGTPDDYQYKTLKCATPSFCLISTYPLSNISHPLHEGYVSCASDETLH